MNMCVFLLVVLYGQTYVYEFFAWHEFYIECNIFQYFNELHLEKTTSTWKITSEKTHRVFWVCWNLAPKKVKLKNPIRIQPRINPWKPSRTQMVYFLQPSNFIRSLKSRSAQIKKIFKVYLDVFGFEPQQYKAHELFWVQMYSPPPLPPHPPPMQTNAFYKYLNVSWLWVYFNTRTV